jgi:hypothetical protein
VGLKGCDFAWRAHPNDALQLAEALKSSGFHFVVRYLSHDGSKNLTVAEIAAYRRVGLGIVTVFEDAADRALGGGAAGVADATYARTLLRALHAPYGPGVRAPVYFALDFDMQPGQEGRCAEYLRGAAQVLGVAGSGVYGGLAAVDTLAAAVRYRWQTVAWSRGRWDAGIEMEQFVAQGTTLGTQWDLDEAEELDYGQWVFVPSVVPPVVPPVIAGGFAIEEDDMPQLDKGTGAQTEISVPAGAASGIQFTVDASAVGKTAPALRVAVHSKAGGWNQIEGKADPGYVLPVSGSVELLFAARDVNGISVIRYAAGSDASVGYALVK